MRRAASRQPSENSSKRSESLDEHQRILDDELAMPLKHLIKQRHLDAPGAVIEAQADARAAPSDLVNQAGDAHRAAGR